MSGDSGVAVTDKMRYGIKPSAVRSETMLHNIKAVNGTSFPLQLGQDIIFEVPALGNGYYCDFSTSYFRLNVSVTLNTAFAGAAADTGYVRFERGPESMFRRIQIFDASGNLLENFENYNDLYCLTELLTNNVNNRRGVASFHGEGFFQATDVMDTLYDEATLSRNLPISYPDLGGGIIGYNYASAEGGLTRIPTKTGAFNLWTASNTEFSNSQKSKGVRQVTFQLMSSLFGGSSDKYLPMSAINGMRIIFSLENALGSLVSEGLNGNLVSAMTVNIQDPTLFMNMVRVDPTVDAALLQAATGPDGLTL